MGSLDRRSGQERRASNRYPVEVEVEWQSARGRAPGSLSDVSLDGCFVLCSGEVVEGETVKVYIPLADGMNVEFDGRVANFVYEIGFGVKFGPLSAAQRELLTTLVHKDDKS